MKTLTHCPFPEKLRKYIHSAVILGTFGLCSETSLFSQAAPARQSSSLKTGEPVTKEKAKEERQGYIPSQKPAIKKFEQLHKYLESLPKDERERLQQLYKEDREMSRAEIRKKALELLREQNENEKRIQLLQHKFRQSDNLQEKETLKAEIEKITRSQFECQMETTRAQIDEIDNRLKDLKERYQQRRTNAEQIIKQRVLDITRDPNLKW